MNTIENINIKNEIEDNILNNLATGIIEFVFYENGFKIIAVNSIMCEITGHTAEEIMEMNGQQLLQVSPEEEQQSLLSHIHSLRNVGTEVAFTYRLLNSKTRKIQWLDARGKSFISKSGEVKAFVTYYDVTKVKEQEMRLHSNLTALGLAQKQAKIAVWIYDMDQQEITIQTMSDKTDAMGYPKYISNVPQVFIDEKSIHPDDEKKVLEAYALLDSGQETVDTIYRLFNRNAGKYDWIHMYYQMIENENGSRQAAGFSVEVNQQQELLERYKTELQMRKQLFVNAPLMVEVNMSKGIIVGMEGGNKTYTNTTEWNNIPFKYYHQYVTSLVAHDYKKLMSDKTSKEGLIKAFQDGETRVVVEFQGRGTKDSPLLYYRTNVFLSKDPISNDVMAFFYTEDIDQQYKRRKAIESCMEDGTDLIALIHVERKQVEIIKNKKALCEKKQTEIFNYEEFIQRFTPAIVGKCEDTDYTLADLKKVILNLEQSEKYEYSRTIRSESGEIQRKLVKFKYLEKTEKEIVFSVTDVTKVYMEEQSKKRQLQKALEDAKQANEITNQFMARMSHDMRTPMNGILGMSYIIEDQVDQQEVRNELHQLRSSGNYLLQLINDILDMNQVERGKLMLVPKVCDEEVVFNSIIAIMKPEIKKKNISFSFEKIDIDWKWMKLDTQRVKQIFINLLSNALKYTPEGGKIDFIMQHVSETDTMIRDKFIIRDTGIGMSKDFISHAFEPFAQENRTQEGLEGSGLGLSIVKTLVELMEGNITIESENGKGTTITVYLNFPLAEKPVEIVEENKTNVENSLENVHILLCEDHPLNAQIAKRLLEKKGALVTVAENGKLGFETFSRSKVGYYKVILMDIRMPEMDGISTSEAIRELNREDAKKIPIIAMTANAFEQDAKDCIAAGMNAHLSKPVEPKALYAMIAKYV